MGSTQGAYHCHNVQGVSENNGELDDEYYDKLDRLLSEVGEYKNVTNPMRVVIVLSNFWYWTGGLSWYLHNASNCTNKSIPCPGVKESFINYTEGFFKCKSAMKVIEKLFDNLANRTNKYKNNITYKDDSTIMAWEIVDDPIANNNVNEFYNWTEHIASYIKERDKNHLVTIGMAGRENASYYKRLHEIKQIDYMTFSLMPMEWNWNVNELEKKTKEFVNNVLKVSRIVRKPLVMNLFRFPRDDEVCSPNSPTKNRDEYYKYVLRLFTEYAEDQFIVGTYFWGWSFDSYPGNETCKLWEVEDPIIGDSTSMYQGYYSIYKTDNSTLEIINNSAHIINNLHKDITIPKYVWMMFAGAAGVFIVCIIIFIAISCRVKSEWEHELDVGADN